MCKLAGLIVVAILSLVSTAALACHRITPHRAPVESHDAVFLGRVTGIHLVGYENSLIGEPDAYVDGRGVTLTDGSAPVMVNAVPLKIHHGESGGSVELRLVGCTAPLPELKERGIFFINSGTTSAVTVWESDEEAFHYWIDRLGLSDDEP